MHSREPRDIQIFQSPRHKPVSKFNTQEQQRARGCRNATLKNNCSKQGANPKEVCRISEPGPNGPSEGRRTCDAVHEGLLGRGLVAVVAFSSAHHPRRSKIAALFLSFFFVYRSPRVFGFSLRDIFLLCCFELLLQLHSFCDGIRKHFANPVQLLLEHGVLGVIRFKALRHLPQPFPLLEGHLRIQHSLLLQVTHLFLEVVSFLACGFGLLRCQQIHGTHREPLG
mmetsp:Transcript_57086/g.98340  ORF Transcript_57086/g.98340 Transcript_57086/m.98340 type:complete len:225 (-) Transcript_57086:735-1409(-)